MPSMFKKWMIDPVHRAGPHYICLTLAGVFGLVYPPPSVKTVTFGHYAFYFWLGSLFVGGLLCVTGRWRGSRGPKILGLGLILTSLVTYMIALIPSWPASASNVFLLMSFSWMLLYRQLRVRRERDADLELRRRAAARSNLASDPGDGAPILRSSDGGPDRRTMDRRPTAWAEGHRLSA